MNYNPNMLDTLQTIRPYEPISISTVKYDRVKDLQKIKVIDGITFEVTTISEIPGTFWVLVRESGHPTWSTSYSFGDMNIIQISIRKITTDTDTDVWIYARLSNGETWRCKIDLQITHIECLKQYKNHCF